MALKPIVFRVKKKLGEETKEIGPWKAVVDGKIIELGHPDAGVSKEDADAKLKTIVAETPQSGPTIGEIAAKAAGEANDAKADSKPKADKAEKPQPGTLRKNGLAELSPERLKKLRETLASAIAEGNLSLDTALVAMFGRDVPQLPPEDLALLKIGWEIACQQWFVDGIPPAWVVILFANVQLTTKLAQLSKPKPKKEQPNAAANGNTGSGNVTPLNPRAVPSTTP